MTGRGYRTVSFRDELLADDSVRRVYADGRQEWRTRTGDGRVTWRDDRGRSGVDEPLGSRIVKRSVTPGAVLYGRDVGYGRTAWGDGVLTVNETSLGARTAAVLSAVGAAGLLPGIVDPPAHLTDAEEQALREQAARPDAEVHVGADPGADWSVDDGGGFDDAGDFG